MVKKNKVKRGISNRILYTLITIGILAILGLGVYALAPGVAPNPGHLISDVAPPSGCSNGTFLQWVGSSWTCASASGGSGSQWTTSGSNIYYSSGNVGIGTNNPTSSLSVGGNFNVVGGTSTFTGQQIALKAPITTNSSLTLGGAGINTINGPAFSVWANSPGANSFGAFINNADPSGTNVGIGLLVAGAEGIRTSSNTLGVYGRSSGGIGVQGEGSTFDFYASGAGTNYGSPSSIRWKNNVQPINNALNIVMNLSGVSFNWDKAHGGQHDIGFIGEQIGQYIPEIVQFDPNSSNPSYYVTGMDYSKMTPVLLEAIKEQQKQIESLKLEVEQLKNK